MEKSRQPESCLERFQTRGLFFHVLRLLERLPRVLLAEVIILKNNDVLASVSAKPAGAVSIHEHSDTSKRILQSGKRKI